SNKIKQVLINLILNAYDAMMEKQVMPSKEEKSWPARLTITTEKASSDHPSLQSYKEKTSGACALLTVSDTGTGIAGSNLEKIFDPFFTTKSPGKGNGLGLAISLRIVESFKGHIYVESTEGEGSTFMIVLPIAGESTN
ncbi:MAG: two-component sensor histidine kinase, partial [Deltaproteobacteria bacterium]|nr:two-component sensor histidine kinase [Deltaproteobacteria bacterium]